MEINPEVKEILREFRIGQDEGILVLLGIYYKLDVEKVCSSEIIQKINLTKIVEKDYARSSTGTVLKWNVSLFIGQQTEWDWVETEYNALWRQFQERKDSNPDCIKRMQEFFKKYPHIRKEDVMRGTTAYFRQLLANRTEPKYVKSSAKFIFDGKGAEKVSMLLKWVENTKPGTTGQAGMVGKLL